MMKSKGVNGYLTIEATLIFTIVIGVYICVIYMLFYQYDRCVFEEEMGILLVKSSVCGLSNNEDRLLYFQQERNRCINESYISSKLTNSSIDIKGNKIELSGQMEFLFFQINILPMREKKNKISIIYRSNYKNPVYTVRGLRRAAQIRYLLNNNTQKED